MLDMPHKLADYARQSIFQSKQKYKGDSVVQWEIWKGRFISQKLAGFDMTSNLSSATIGDF